MHSSSADLYYNSSNGLQSHSSMSLAGIEGFDQGSGFPESAYWEACKIHDASQVSHLMARFGTTTASHAIPSDLTPSKFSTLNDAMTCWFPSPARPRQPVPQRDYVPPPGKCFNPSPRVVFRVHGREGIYLERALNNDVKDLEGCNQVAFNLPNAKLSFRLEWLTSLGAPGYPPYSHQITVRDATSTAKPISKAKMAHKIAKELVRFIKQYELYPFPQAEWKVGPGFIQLHNLELVALDHVSEGSLQAVLNVTR